MALVSLHARFLLRSCSFFCSAEGSSSTNVHEDTLDCEQPGARNVIAFELQNEFSPTNVVENRERLARSSHIHLQRKLQMFLV